MVSMATVKTTTRRAAGVAEYLQPARSREVGGATETLPTKAERVSEDGACAYRFRSKVVTLTRPPRGDERLFD